MQAFESTRTPAQVSSRARRHRVLFAALGLLLVGTAARARAADTAAITEQNVAEHLASAHSAQDHQAIAAFFRSEAAAAGDHLKMHEAMLASWEKSVAGRSLQVMREHCHAIMRSLTQMQKDYEAMAQEHEKLAKMAKQETP